MSDIQANDLADLITTTQKELGEMRFTEIATDLQEHVAMSRLLQESSVTFDAGPVVQWNLMTGTTGSAKMTGLFAVDDVNVGDVMATAQINWRHVNANYAIERREIAFNRDPRKIVDLVRVRRVDAMISLAQLMEDQFWGSPSSDADNKLNGVGYWVSQGVSNQSAGEGDFVGGAAYGSTVAGLDVNTFPRWQNWLGAYNVDDLDGTDAGAGRKDYGATGTFPILSLSKAIREAYVKMQFQPIYGAEHPRYVESSRYGIYAPYSVVSGLEDIALRVNDAVKSNDVAVNEGQATFRGVPITYVPKLDSSSINNPIYMLNWGSLKSVFLRGEYMREQGPDVAPNQHTTLVTHVDSTMNLYCTDRRRNALLYSVA